MAGTIAAPETLSLGDSLPIGDPHGVSVQLPTWADTVGWASRKPRVLNAMLTGYPRFFIPRVVDVLGEKILQRHAKDTGTSMNGRRTLLVASRRHALLCQRFLAREKPCADLPPSQVLQVNWCGLITPMTGGEETSREEPFPGKEDIFVISYPAELFPTAKAFWQHTGSGISSRRATYWLEHAPFLRGQANGSHLRPFRLPAIQFDTQEIRTRISTVLNVASSNVSLYPTGMAAIMETATAIQDLRGHLRNSPCVAAVFGFLYVDTYKVLTRVLGYEVTLYTYEDADIDKLEERLASGQHLDVLFTEFPGNPLLQSPDLPRLHRLSKRYNFVLVVDDTVGSGNVNVISSCDVTCTSLTKMFSGACNVMGGSVTLSPESPYHDGLCAALQTKQQDNLWFPEDVAVMEGNSRDFLARVRRASVNAEAMVQQLRDHPSVVEVYYPKGSPTQLLYDVYRGADGKYGFLLSVRFASPAKAVAFYDALDTAKGPSLGTNFTLTCAYTLLAHYSELEWAAGYGVVEDLVRISVGLEDKMWLKGRVDKALQAAELTPMAK